METLLTSLVIYPVLANEMPQDSHLSSVENKGTHNEHFGTFLLYLRKRCVCLSFSEHILLDLENVHFSLAWDLAHLTSFLRHLTRKLLSFVADNCFTSVGRSLKFYLSEKIIGQLVQKNTLSA